MRNMTGTMVIAAMLGLSMGTALAADPMEGKEAKPTIGERLTKEGIKGTLMKIEGEYYTVKENEGKQYKLHVDKSSKVDKVVEGDKVKAFVTDEGHVTTLQRQAK